ncbi:MAG: GNAT family protein [Rhodanobacter sp.]
MVVNVTLNDAIELNDGVLRLRPWRHADIAQLREAVEESVDSVGRWLPWCHAGYGQDEAAAWVSECRAGWKSGQHFAFPLFDANSERLLGCVGLNQVEPLHRRANLGYWVRQSCQRQGHAAAAARLVARFGFEQLGLIRIEVVILPDNRPSRATAERTGASFESIARNRLWVRGKERDAAVYGLIPQDLA